MTPTLERAWPRQSGVRGGPLVVARSYGARHRLAYARLYVEANREKINEKQRISRVRAKKKAAAGTSAPKTTTALDESHDLTAGQGTRRRDRRFLRAGLLHRQTQAPRSGHCGLAEEVIGTTDIHRWLHDGVKVG